METKKAKVIMLPIIKNSWNKEEVEDLLIKGMTKVRSDMSGFMLKCSDSTIRKWIKKNL